MCATWSLLLYRIKPDLFHLQGEAQHVWVNIKRFTVLVADHFQRTAMLACSFVRAWNVSPTVCSSLNLFTAVTWHILWVIVRILSQSIQNPWGSKASRKKNKERKQNNTSVLAHTKGGVCFSFLVFGGRHLGSISMDVGNKSINGWIKCAKTN